MKKTFMTTIGLCTLGMTALVFTACQKNAEALNSVTNGTAETATSNLNAITVVSSATVANADSIDVVQTCNRGEHRDSIAQASLPGAVATYLDANYQGYTFDKAFTILDANAAISGYVVIVYYNDKPVGLQFDGSGTFVKVLEQRDHGSGGRHRGHFLNRGEKGHDSVALNVLPTAIATYFTANYSGDTLLKAFRNYDSSYVVLSKNAGVFASVFDANGVFVKRVELPVKGARGNAQLVDETALPAAIRNYLTQTYPNYVFQKGFVLSGAAGGFVVVIDANNTKYAIAFDAKGNFIAAKTLF